MIKIKNKNKFHFEAHDFSTTPHPPLPGFSTRGGGVWGVGHRFFCLCEIFVVNKITTGWGGLGRGDKELGKGRSKGCVGLRARCNCRSNYVRTLYKYKYK